MIFHPNFSHPRQYIHHKLLTREGRVVATGWTHPSSMTIFVHLFIRGVIWNATIVALNTIWHEISHLVAVCSRKWKKKGGRSFLFTFQSQFHWVWDGCKLNETLWLVIECSSITLLGWSVASYRKLYSMRAVYSYNDWPVSIIKCYIYIYILKTMAMPHFSQTFRFMQASGYQFGNWAKGHFTYCKSQEPWPRNCESPQESVRRLSVPTHLQTHVVWSRTLKCSVKSYVTGPSTKCWLNEFLFMRVLTRERNRINQWLWTFGVPCVPVSCQTYLLQEVVFENSPSHHETRSIQCHVALHVDFTSILHSHTLLVLQAQCEASNLDWLRVIQGWECLKCNGHGLSTLCVEWSPIWYATSICDLGHWSLNQTW